MTRFRMNPLFPVQPVRNELDHWFSDFFPGSSRLGESVWQSDKKFPAVNVWENEGQLFAEAELPGLTQDELTITVMGNELTIKGERPEVEQEGATFHRRERGVGSFTRVVRLPVEVDSAKVSADLRDGVLLVTLPKAEAARTRKIPIGCAN